MIKVKGKRNYNGYVKDNGKWFTGYDGDALTEEGAEKFKARWPRVDPNYLLERKVNIVDHEHRELKLKFVTTSKGRSSAVAIFQDEENFQYALTFIDFGKLFHIISNTGEYPEYAVRLEGDYIVGWFNQCKKGQNYFITMSKKKEVES
jgi:hypothetical protein